MGHLSLPHSPCTICVEVPPTYYWGTHCQVHHPMHFSKWNGHVTPMGPGRGSDSQRAEAMLERLVGIFPSPWKRLELSGTGEGDVSRDTGGDDCQHETTEHREQSWVKQTASVI